MRGKWFKAILLSALMVTALLAPLMAVSSSTTTPEPTSGSPTPLSVVDNYHVILKGKDTAEQKDFGGPPSDWPYPENSNPPIMVGKKGIGSGAVVATGIGRTLNGGITYSTLRWTPGELDVLLDNVFQWMVPGAENVLWYGEYLAQLYIDEKYEYVYNDAERCSWLIDNLRAKGYTVDNTIDDVFTPITSGLLAPYDILFLPAIQLGASGTGGDPSLLPDSDVQVIKSFVKNGGGLFIVESGDSDAYNFHKVQNKILTELGFAYSFQDDSIIDPVNNDAEKAEGYPPSYAPVVNVDNTTWTGSAYENETSKTEVQLYKPCSLRPLIEHGVSLTPTPSYRNCLPGSSVTFRIEVKNTSDLFYDNFVLGATDNLGWVENADLSENVFLNVERGTSGTTTLTVAVPDNKELYRVQDNIVLTAVSTVFENVTSSITVTVYPRTWIKPPTDDTEAVEHENKAGVPQGARKWMYVGSSTTEFKNERAYLKFDLGEGLPAGYTIENARLYLYCFTVMGATGKNVQTYGMDNDDWSEENLTWNYQPAGAVTLLDSVSVTENDRWYSWDVTSFLGNYPTDNIVSFLLRAENEGLESPDNFSYGFDTKEYTDRYLHPYLAFGVRPVASYFTENYGSPGENVVVDAVINNRGAVVDNYDVTIASQSGWTVSPTATVLNNVSPGENRVVPVTVTIPGGATPKTWENLILTVTSKTDENYTSSITDAGVWVGYIFDLVGGKWNLVGFPATDENTTPDNVLPETYYIWRWDPVGGTYVSPSSTAPVDENIGYWIWVEDDWEVRIGVPVASGTINLVGGKWNLVGFPATDANTTPDNLFAGHTYYIWKWDPVGGTYVSPSSTAPVELSVGYWVWIDSDKTVTVPVT